MEKTKVLIEKEVLMMLIIALNWELDPTFMHEVRGKSLKLGVRILGDSSKMFEYGRDRDWL